ncbi:MAG: glutaredoxin 3, partial [Bdellovibrionota bacterium]
MESLPKNAKQASVLVYTKDYCPYCDAAKNLLTQKGVGYDEIDVSADRAQFEVMLKRSAPRRTVPQIFVGETAIGGFTDMQALDAQGKLEV